MLSPTNASAITTCPPMSPNTRLPFPSTSARNGVISVLLTATTTTPARTIAEQTTLAVPRTHSRATQLPQPSHRPHRRQGTQLPRRSPSLGSAALSRLVRPDPVLVLPSDRLFSSSPRATAWLLSLPAFLLDLLSSCKIELGNFGIYTS